MLLLLLCLRLILYNASFYIKIKGLFMKLYLLFPTLFILHGCFSTSEEITVKDTIKTNTEACIKAQSEYLKLRKNRSN